MTALLKEKAKEKKVTKKVTKQKATNKTLVIVESPAKAKTIEKYLGKNYIVRASMGHLRDLPKSQFGIDIEHDFTPKYINIRGKGDLIKSLKKEAKDAKKVYLASDPDREGEAIAWHLAHILEISPEAKCRIVFNEITKNAIKKAVEEPNIIHIDRVDAQQARRMLDRIVGYKLSPLLWRKVKKGLSAGRVQSVTLKLICDREKEIMAFISVEYWTISVKLRHQKSKLFEAELVAIDGKKPVLPDEKSAQTVVRDLEKESITVKDIKESERKKKPSPPFNTSTLQQDAARKLGFTSRKTMMIAQQLYEGVELGRKGPVGLITYMRTDSVRISSVALTEARKYLLDNFGDPYVPKIANIYTSSKNSQDAHEAIRPTSVDYTPNIVGKFLNRDQLRLYTLIWQRFLASQMTVAIYDILKIELQAGKYTLRASGKKLKFKGFTAIYAGSEEDSGKNKDVLLPEMQVGDSLKTEKIMPEQHFTEPPPRYNEASLVKTLEEKGIGRPSTYAPTIETILGRGYVERREKQFKPTELGFIVVDMLEEYFPNIVDVKFTADLEQELDEIAIGKISKNKLLEEFYPPFEKTLVKADEAIGQIEIPVEVSDVECEYCGRKMVVKLGRYGKFLACPGFPDCKNTKPILKETGAFCPKCHGAIVERRSKKGRMFYGCKNYPDCDFVTWDKPLVEPCKECQSLMLTHRFKNGRALVYCTNEFCKTRENHPINKELERINKKAEPKDTNQDSKNTNDKKKTTKKTATKKSKKKATTKTKVAKT